MHPLLFFSFFFYDPAPTDIYTLSLHDALPISHRVDDRDVREVTVGGVVERVAGDVLRRCQDSSDAEARRDERQRRQQSPLDRKSTRLNSSHQIISYAVFCLKKKKKKQEHYDKR